MADAVGEGGAPGTARGARAREHAPVAALVAVALALRLPALGRAPNPCGDEGNWAGIALRLARGEPAGLADDAGFVTTAYAHAIAAVFRVAGPGFAAARLVAVVAVVLAIVAAWVACARGGERRAGLAVGAVLAVHPWSVAWSRTASVPYALGLATAVAGVLLARRALATGGRWQLVAGASVASAGFHFSPLAAVPCAAIVALALAHPARRALARRPATWAAAALALVHPAVVASGALRAARATAADPRPFHDAGRRAVMYADAALGMLTGEGTLRHFAGIAPVGAAALAALVLAAAALGCARGAPRLARLGAVYLAGAALALPSMLLLGRDWYLPAIDAERYGFVLVAPFALVIGGLAEARDRARRALAWGTVASLALCATAPGVAHFARGGGQDRGLFVARMYGAEGGGYRGWKVAQDDGSGRAIPARVVDAVLADARPGEAVALYAHDYAWHTLAFELARRGDPRVRRVRALPAAGAAYALAWSEGLFAPRFVPSDAIARNAAVLAAVRAEPSARRVWLAVQPDGTPLCELWRVR